MNFKVYVHDLIEFSNLNYIYIYSLKIITSGWFTNIDRSNPYNCQKIHGIRSLHQIMTTGSSRPYAINVREKSWFCVDYIEENANIVQCENIRDGYVSRWEMKQLISVPPFDENDNVDVYDPLYSTDYECVSDLVVIGT